MQENIITEMMIKGQETKDKRTLTALQNDLIYKASMYNFVSWWSLGRNVNPEIMNVPKLEKCLLN